MNLLVQSLCGHTPNPVQYFDFGDNISLLGMLKYIPILWVPMSRAKFFTARPSDGCQKNCAQPRPPKFLYVVLETS